MVKTYNKFNESATNPETERVYLMNQCVSLFKEVWEDKLLIIKTNIEPTNDFNGYQLWCVVNRDIKNESLKDFVKLFEMIDELGFKYRFGANRLDVYIDDIQSFIDEMSIIINANKYNL